MSGENEWRVVAGKDGSARLDYVVEKNGDSNRLKTAGRKTNEEGLKRTARASKTARYKAIKPVTSSRIASLCDVLLTTQQMLVSRIELAMLEKAKKQRR